ncbi:hypothetical protein [Xanthovirga aplysinae]|uniref:hypothetical protein n=1 Tax=Xanthovirga aplysinae TaxID=2529853 RepID=UPI0012BCB104|nr:hypothetical protein [Xanthovirga aplysinae]
MDETQLLAEGKACFADLSYYNTMKTAAKLKLSIAETVYSAQKERFQKIERNQ